MHKSPDTVGVLTYALRVCQDLVVNREFRFEVRSRSCKGGVLRVSIVCAACN